MSAQIINIEELRARSELDPVTKSPISRVARVFDELASTSRRFIDQNDLERAMDVMDVIVGWPLPTISPQSLKVLETLRRRVLDDLVNCVSEALGVEPPSQWRTAQ